MARPKRSPEHCTLEGCERRYYCKGYCLAHYTRVRKNGHPGSPDVRPVKPPKPKYSTIHTRLNVKRGKASEHTCPCGRQASSWAYLYTDSEPLVSNQRDSKGCLYSADLTAYIALCSADHRALDALMRDFRQAGAA